MINLCINHEFAYELEHVVRIFYPGEKIQVSREPETVQGQWMESLLLPRDDGAAMLIAGVHMEDFDQRREALVEGGGSEDWERGLARLLFQLLCQRTGHRPPWGILTGVRPVRLCNEMLERGMSEEQAAGMLTGEYLALPEKVNLVLQTGRREAAVLARRLERGYSLYIGIPFCPTRCLYCSFVSHDIEKAAKLVPDYLDCLCRELEEIGAIADSLGLTLQSIYMGGGTPTTLEAGQLERILSTVNRCFDRSQLLEFTVEAGRPDTITAEKLAVLRSYGVDRISVNPQTMNNEILNSIGRRHTAAQIVESYQLVRDAGFSMVNMDLIAGLPGESGQSFLSTVEQVLALAPENITVHTLTVKRSSGLRRQDGVYDGAYPDLSELLDRSREVLLGQDYRPYYLYRQKGTVQNLENVGYAKPGTESIYNVFIMEEVHTVLAAGAGATTKLYGAPDRLERVFNYKFPYEYIGRFGEMLARKASIKEFYEEL